MDAAFVPCTLPPLCTFLPPLPFACVSSRPCWSTQMCLCRWHLKKIVLKIVGLLLLFAILCGAFFRQRFAIFALLSFFLALVAQIFFLVFCFGPTPFGKLMRKFLVKCEISRYFSKHTHSHTQEASECACVQLYVCVCDGFLSVCKLATTARCLFDAACPRSCLSTCLCRLIDGYYAHLYSDLSRTPCTPHSAPFSPLWVAYNLTQTTRWSSPWAAHQCQHSAHSFYFTYQISWQKDIKSISRLSLSRGLLLGCFAWCSGLD